MTYSLARVVRNHFERNCLDVQTDSVHDVHVELQKFVEIFQYLNIMSLNCFACAYHSADRRNERFVVAAEQVVVLEAVHNQLYPVFLAWFALPFEVLHSKYF